MNLFYTQPEQEDEYHLYSTVLMSQMSEEQLAYFKLVVYIYDDEGCDEKSATAISYAHDERYWFYCGETIDNLVCEGWFDCEYGNGFVDKHIQFNDIFME